MAGKETNQAKTDCQDCPIGKYKTQGGVAPCTECPPEKVNEKVGSKLVTECTIGRYFIINLFIFHWIVYKRTEKTMYFICGLIGLIWYFYL